MGKITGFLEIDRHDRKYAPAADRVQHYREFVIPLSEKDTRDQAARCMNCGIPYCHGTGSVQPGTPGCPVNNQIPDFNDLVYQDNWQEASRNLHSTNNFPEFTGRICPAPCEASCTLNIDDNPVTIKTIECAIVDRAWDNGWLPPEIAANKTGKKIAVVGAGPAGLGEFFVDMDVVAGTRELLRGREARRAGADDRDLLAGLLRRDFRLQPATIPGAVDDGAFDGLDGDRVVVDVKRAGRLARGWADAAGELGEIVGRVQIARGFFPIAGIDQIVEIRNLVVDRAARRARRHRAGAVAIGNAAIHAARGLVAGVLLAQGNDEFAVALHALGDRLVLAVVPLDLEKTCNLAHLTRSP